MPENTLSFDTPRVPRRSTSNPAPDTRDVEAVTRTLIDGDGLVRYRSACNPKLAQALEKTVVDLARQRWGESAPSLGAQKRLGNVLEVDPEGFGELLATAPFLKEGGPMERLLGPGFQIGSLHCLILYPSPPGTTNETDEKDRRSTDAMFRGAGVHADFPYGAAHSECVLPHSGQFPDDLPPTCQAIWMLTPQTPGELGNGATSFLPGSQKWWRNPKKIGHQEHMDPKDERHRDSYLFESQFVEPGGDYGDAIVYNGQAWHAVSPNRTHTPRVALLGEFLPFCYAPMEPHAVLTPERVVKRLPIAVRALLGQQYNCKYGQFGFKHATPFRIMDERTLTELWEFAADTVYADLGARRKKGFVQLGVLKFHGALSRGWMYTLFGAFALTAVWGVLADAVVQMVGWSAVEGRLLSVFGPLFGRRVTAAALLGGGAAWARGLIEARVKDAVEGDAQRKAEKYELSDASDLGRFVLAMIVLGFAAPLLVGNIVTAAVAVGLGYLVGVGTTLKRLHI